MEYRQVIEREFAQRVAQNPRYSLRAFSRDLGMSPGRLSLLLNRKSGVSPAVAQKISRKLALSPNERARFLESVTAVHGRSRRQREAASQNLRRRRVDLQPLSEDLFRVISDWPHLAILEEVQIEGFRPDFQELAKRLGIAWSETKAAWDRLVRLGLLVEKAGCWVSGNNSILGKSPSEAIRNFHRQLLQKALVALDSQTMEERDNSAILFSVNPAEVAAIGAEIRAFRRGLIQKFQYNAGDAEVYAFCAQLFRLTRR